MLALTITHNLVLKAFSLILLILLMNVDNIPAPLGTPKYIPPPQLSYDYKNAIGQCDILLIPLLVLTIGSLFLFITEKVFDKFSESKAKNSSTKSQHPKVLVKDSILDSSLNVFNSSDNDDSPTPPMQHISASSRRSRKASKINFEISADSILRNVFNQKEFVQILLDVALRQLTNSETLPEDSKCSFLAFDASDLRKFIRSKEEKSKSKSAKNNTSQKVRRNTFTLRKVRLGRRSTQMR